MKLIGILALLAVMIASGCVSGPLTQSVESNTIFVSPSSQNVNVGDVVTVYVDFNDVNNVLGFQFDLGYDNEVLELSSVEEADFLKSMGHDTYFVKPDTDTPGMIKHVAEAALNGGDGISGSGKIAKITFTALKAGKSDLELSGVKVIGKGMEELQLNLVSGSVNVM